MQTMLFSTFRPGINDHQGDFMYSMEITAGFTFNADDLSMRQSVISSYN